ncbi:AAA family ATPase [Curtobacterium sp. YC1]|uniref:AAA family ATPase n=1 Tax=Curtobacterium sp. YC1 TaxID=2795488 RepID=UPI0018E4E725|nr:AAA family ATPase [Curtobacterium sp. YC1]
MRRCASRSGTCRCSTGLLGRSELAFTPSDDGKHYKIERSGLPATNLSEGERTAIALLHFLASIREGVFRATRPSS